MIRRYERAQPGELVHVDIKKLGRIPNGGGHRICGRQQADQNKRATTSQRRNCKPVIGYAWLHTAIDDHSRLAYTEILADERQPTAAAFWRRADAWFTERGITVQRVMTDIQTRCASGLRIVRPVMRGSGVTGAHPLPLCDRLERLRLLAR